MIDKPAIAYDQKLQDVQSVIIDDNNARALTEEEIRQVQPPTVFINLSDSIAIGFNPNIKNLIFFRLKVNDKVIKMAVANINVSLNDAEVWDEQNVTEM